MMTTKERRALEERTKDNLARIRQGDLVKVVNCLEAARLKENVFKVISDAYKIGGTYCVKLEGLGYFDIGRLEKVANDKR